MLQNNIRMTNIHLDVIFIMITVKKEANAADVKTSERVNRAGMW